jgi:hypothetical protein
MTKGILYHVELPYASGGIIVDRNNIIVEAPPIFIWAKRKKLHEFEAWVFRKHGRVFKSEEGK